EPERDGQYREHDTGAPNRRSAAASPEPLREPARLRHLTIGPSSIGGGVAPASSPGVVAPSAVGASAGIPSRNLGRAVEERTAKRLRAFVYARRQAFHAGGLASWPIVSRRSGALNDSQVVAKPCLQMQSNAPPVFSSVS